MENSEKVRDENIPPEQAPEQQPFVVRWGVIEHGGKVELITDETKEKFDDKVRSSDNAMSETRTLKNKADVQPWLEAMNNLVAFRNEHRVGYGNVSKTEGSLDPKDQEELKRLKNEVKQYEIEN